MIYSHKPQRSGRDIQANTNNPPQDPPPPSETPQPIVETPIPEIVIPDIPIEDTTPPVPEPCIHEAPTLPKPEKKIRKTPKKVTPKPEKKIVPKTVKKPVEKITWRTRIVSFFKKLFRRSV